jgi:uncharacterized protein (TIGR02569 family)
VAGPRGHGVTPRPPPVAVLDGFGLAGPCRWLPGGHAGAWRAGAAVLKPLDMSTEAMEWQAAVLGAVDGSSVVRVAPPVRSASGELVVQGWTAWRHEPGAPPGADWGAVLDAGRALHGLVSDLPRPVFLDRRQDAWARADRVAWQEAPPRGAHRMPHLAPVFAALGPVRRPAQVVHGDLTGNVHLSPSGSPVVLDVTPYWRPVEYAAAIVVVDAVAHQGAPLDLADDVAAQEGSGFAQCLLRALLFRAVTDHLLAPDDVEQADRYSALAEHAVSRATVR